MKNGEKSSSNSNPGLEENDELRSKTSSSSTPRDEVTKNEEHPDSSSENNETRESGKVSGEWPTVSWP